MGEGFVSFCYIVSCSSLYNWGPAAVHWGSCCTCALLRKSLLMGSDEGFDGREVPNDELVTTKDFLLREEAVVPGSPPCVPRPPESPIPLAASFLNFDCLSIKIKKIPCGLCLFPVLVRPGPRPMRRIVGGFSLFALSFLFVFNILCCKKKFLK